MNSNAKKWVEALRSGKYKQGKYALHRKGSWFQKDRFCCLGVACDLAVKDKVVSRSRTANYLGKFSYDGSEGELPILVAQRLGLRDTIGNNTGRSLDLLNDYDDLSFNEIADIIESEPEGLFV